MLILRRFSRKSTKSLRVMPTISGPEASNQDASVQQSINVIKGKISKIEERMEIVQKKIDEKYEEAKSKIAKGNQKAALMVIRTKKLYESELSKLQNASLLLEGQLISVESFAIQQEIANTFIAGMCAMRQIAEERNAKKLHDIQSAKLRTTSVSSPVNDSTLLVTNALIANEQETNILDPLPSDDREPIALDAPISNDFEPILSNEPQQSTVTPSSTNHQQPSTADNSMLNNENLSTVAFEAFPSNDISSSVSQSLPNDNCNCETSNSDDDMKSITSEATMIDDDDDEDESCITFETTATQSNDSNPSVMTVLQAWKAKFALMSNSLAAP